MFVVVVYVSLGVLESFVFVLAGLGTPKRRMSPAVLPSPSLSRMHRDSLSQEAPITKVAN